MHHRYAPVPGSCPAARRDLHTFLLPYDLDDELVHDLVLVLNELVANAVDHARTSFSVTVTVSGSAVRIGVEDSSAQPPHLRPLDTSSYRGHGLRIIDAVATTWSVTPSATGKTVHADLTIA